MLQKISQFLMPVYEGENPAWFFKSARLIFALTLFAIPLAYDLKVAEVAGDPRWNLMHWSTLLLTTLFFASKVQTGAKLTFKWPVAVWVAIALAITASLTLLWTESLIRSWWFLKHFLAYILLFSFAYSLRNENWYRNLIWLLAIAMLYNASLGILQFLDVKDTQINDVVPFREDILNFFQTSKYGIVRAFPIEHILMQIDYFRMSAPPAGTLSNKNLAGSYMVLSLPLMAYLFLTARTLLGKSFASICFTVGCIFMVYTRSRGSWIALCCATLFMAIWLVFTPKHRKILKSVLTKQNLLFIATSVLIIVCASFAKSPLTGFHSIDKTVAEQVSSIATISGDEVGTRLAYNRNGVEIVKENPFGIGIGAFHTIYPKYHNAAMATPALGFSILARPQRMHNDLGQAFVELGVLGGLLYLTLFGCILFMVYHLSKRCAKHQNVELFSLFTLVAIVGLAVNSLGDFPLQMPTAPGILWTYMGMLAGLYALYAPERKVGFTLCAERKVRTPVFVVLAIAAAASLGVVAKDDWARRTGAILLKPVISYTRSQQFTWGLLEHMNKAYNAYPYNTRTREYLGVVVVNLQDRRLNTDTKMKILSEMLKYDPYSPNGNINLCGLALQKAREAAILQDMNALKKYIDMAEDYHKILLKVAPFSEHTHSLGGLIYLYKNEDYKSVSSYKEALRINPDFPSAISGVKQAEAVIRSKGKWDEYQRMQNSTLRVPAF